MTAKIATATVGGLGLALWIGFGRGGEPKGTPAPELTGITAWVNTGPLKLAEQKGKVLVLHF